MEVVKFLIYQDTFGRIAILILSLGLFCYAAWKYSQMVLNAEDHDQNLLGYVTRFTWLGPFIFYIILGIHGLWQLYKWYFGDFQYESEELGRFIQFVETLPGKWVAAFLALLFLVNAVTLFYLAFSGRYSIMLTGKDFHQTSPRLARAVGLVGYIGYGLALFITAVLFVLSIFYAGVSFMDEQESVFRFLLQQEWGKMTLTVIAIGTISFGMYFLFTAYYRWKLGRDPKSID
jgi:hypothetical protein